MGGKALKKVKASRISAKYYNLIKQEIFNSFHDIMIAFPYESPNKIDFGDLDILYQHFPNKPGETAFDLKQFIINKYNTPDIVVNGSVISFAYPFSSIKHLLDETDQTNQINQTNSTNQTEIYFQVDFIKSSNLGMSSFYFSFGDLGNILGRIVKYHGLRFGDHGLFLSPISETANLYMEQNSEDITITTELNKLNEFVASGINELNRNSLLSEIIMGSNDIVLSNNPEEICNYLGLDYEKYGVEHFTSFEKIFDWIISTPLFDKKIFTHLNYEHRHKTETRPMYNKFIEYIGLQVDQIQTTQSATQSITQSATQSTNQSAVDTIKAKNQLEALFHFNKEQELKDIIFHNIIKKIRHEKFNGRKLMKYGIIQKDIGKFIQIFTNYVILKYVTDFNKWLDNNTVSTIDNVLAECLSLYNINLNV